MFKIIMYNVGYFGGGYTEVKLLERLLDQGHY